MFAWLKSMFFWSVILLGVFFSGRLSANSAWFNQILSDSTSQAKIHMYRLLVDTKNKLKKATEELINAEKKPEMQVDADVDVDVQVNARTEPRAGNVSQP
jgi:hypothetical protein